MKDSTLLRIALITSVIGLTALLITLDSIEIDEVAVSKLNNELIDETVEFTGVVKTVDQRDKVIKLVVEQVKDVEVVLFTNQESGLEVGDLIKVVGEVERYNDEWEIIADTINHINEE